VQVPSEPSDWQICAPVRPSVHVQATDAPFVHCAGVPEHPTATATAATTQQAAKRI
jgi:hypothetical protein